MLNGSGLQIQTNGTVSNICGVGRQITNLPQLRTSAMTGDYKICHN
jgi:hypothetical protein